MIIFFASMAYYFSEHASQAVSRESVAALTPLEKHAPLAQPLSQNTPKSARNSTGADNSHGDMWRKRQGYPIAFLRKPFMLDRLYTLVQQALAASNEWVDSLSSS
jgi:hypothetical protein